MGYPEQFKTKMEDFLSTLNIICKKKQNDSNKYILANEFNILWIQEGGKDFQLIEWQNNEETMVMNNDKITIKKEKKENIQINLFGPLSTEVNSAEEYNKIMEFFKGKQVQGDEQSKFKFLEDKFINDYFHQIHSFAEDDLIPQKYPEELSGTDKYYIIAFSNILEASAEDMAENFMYNISPEFMDAYSLYKN